MISPATLSSAATRKPVANNRKSLEVLKKFSIGVLQKEWLLREPGIITLNYTDGTDRLPLYAKRRVERSRSIEPRWLLRGYVVRRAGTCQEKGHRDGRPQCDKGARGVPGWVHGNEARGA
jgi:hypothetical protein